MKYQIVALLALLATVNTAVAEIVTIDPNEVSLNEHVHTSLPPELLPRIKATTNVFEPIDGISYEQAVDLYKRDLNPESNLIIWEEMARVYTAFCAARCTSPEERMDVYRTLLLRSMYSPEETIKNLQLSALSKAEAVSIINQYNLKAEPIPIMVEQ
ncbi:hypothetical protein [Pseudomonas sp. Gutcm_11s]|uniref:hypothetical protein n=1 Tax=Pseudomonas sp. Gutcm_11s TaxID=3026088 RepID=UPI00235FA6BF|nr:hypothetical protein [Pseudomonas sp. Gutcm_11s]MDD0841251.1 hypothetical protein [Pseudomonas sp. Gutcm_11s]